MTAPVAYEEAIAALGEIVIYPSRIDTPSGSFPMRGSHWTITDQTIRTETTPMWAVIFAIVLVWACLLSLLFLLVKEPKTTGYVEITVQTQAGWHRTQVPVANADEVMQLRRWVDYCRHLANA